MLKKISIALLSLFLFMSCVSTESIETKMEIETINDISGIELEILSPEKHGDSMYQSAHKDSGFIKGFNIQIINNTNTIAKIVWNNSSITDSENSHHVFISGQKYIKSNDSVPDQAIPQKGHVKKLVCSADSVSYSYLGNTWVVNPMQGYDFILNICVLINGEEKYITKNINITF